MGIARLHRRGRAARPAASEQIIPFFGFCPYGGGMNCVVDGDTFYLGRQKIRIANIDAPETHPPRCAEEARLGEAATDRLRGLLNSGDVTLSGIGRDEDVYRPQAAQRRGRRGGRRRGVGRRGAGAGLRQRPPIMVCVSRE